MKTHEEDTRASDRHLLQLATPPAHPAGISGRSWADARGGLGSRRVKQEDSARTALRSSLLRHSIYVSRRSGRRVGIHGNYMD